MDVYEYHFKGDQSGKTQLVYHIKLNDNEKVILEALVNKDVQLPKRPTKARSCNDLSINERTVRQINSGELSLYILRKNGAAYNITLVGSASYAQISKTSTGYSTPNARYSYKFAQPANGIDLASNNSNSSVYFKGTLSHECPKKYLFTENSTSGDKRFREFVLIPEIGILEEKSGRNENNAKNVRQLARINGQQITDFIRQYCGSSLNKGKFFSGNRSGTVDDTNSTSTTDLEFDPFGQPGNTTNTTTGNGNTTTVITDNNSPGPGTNMNGSVCTIYKDMDKGLYFDWQTGQLANTACGGNRYVNGYMVGGITTTTPPRSNPVPPTNTRPTPQPDVVIIDNPDPVPYNECGVSSRFGMHVVQRGETLYGISRQYSLSLNQLRQWNRLTSTTLIKPCMQLLTRSPQAAQEPAAPIETDYTSQFHTVNRNETLYGIARKHGFTVDRLRQMNGLSNNDQIYVGQQLKVNECNCPADSGTVAYADNGRNTPMAYEAAGERIKSGTVNNSTRRQFHVVKENDTIYSIAKKHRISVAQLRSINDLEKNEIIIPYQRIYLEN